MKYYEDILDSKEIRLGAVILLQPNSQKNANLVLAPSILAFKSNLDQVIAGLNKVTDTSAPNLIRIYNSILDEIVSEVLIYFENRLKILSIKNDVGKVNDVSRAISLFKKEGVDLDSKGDTGFLKKVDIERGKRHHTNEKYAPVAVLIGNEFNIQYIKKLVQEVGKVIRSIDKELYKKYPDYEVIKEDTPEGFSLKFLALRHTCDMSTGKIKPK